MTSRPIAETPRARVPPAQRGHFEALRGVPGLVVAAPHGSYDTGTDAIVRDLAAGTGWSAVVAKGFTRIDEEHRRFSVNRPTEGRPSAGPAGEVETEAARQVFAAYRRHVLDVAQGKLRLYVEVHGHAHPEATDRIEIATVGVRTEEARALKTLLEQACDARRLRFAIAIEGIDRLRYMAAAAKRRGLLAAAPRALHVELPRAARTTDREAATSMLADLLSRSPALLLPETR
jgi:hypothetical protein